MNEDSVDWIAFVRLRDATESERSAFLAALGVKAYEPPSESTSSVGVEQVAFVLAGEARRAMGDKRYRDLLIESSKAASSPPGWKEPAIADSVQITWLEDYLLLALLAAHLKKEGSTAEDIENLQSLAQEILRGTAPTAADQVAGGAGAALKAAAVVAFAPVAALAFLDWLVSPSMKRILPAIALLAHIRRRLEFEALLLSQEEAI